MRVAGGAPLGLDRGMLIRFAAERTQQFPACVSLSLGEAVERRLTE